ncbi:MAG: phospholipid carrier-dependent glycosyltransferase [Microbacteriaceae bacterium]|nr:phospholipid carrier-dependent glycosyltransferase [Microbacteriaceae bacterium]
MSVSVRLREIRRRIAALSPRVQTALLYGPVLVLASLIRLVNLQSPRALVFDEVYYVRDAWTMWNLGYEAEWVAAGDFAGGDVNSFTRIGDFIAHPPLGKWIIGSGMALFGPENPFGWRIATALAGIIVVLLVMLIARRLFHSIATAAVAGFLVAIDGIAITMSRTALLDGFLAMFILAAFLAIIRHLDTPGWGGWLLMAGVLIGAATAVKWSGLYAMAAFGLWVVAVETLRIVKARRGKRFVVRSALSALRSFALFIPVALVVYVSSWAGWVLSSGGYSRSWAADVGYGDGPYGIARGLWKYHRDIYDYNIGLTDPHNYQANPFGWLAMIRPTAFYYAPTQTDGVVQYVTSVANPVIWWAGALSIVALIVMVIRKATWQNVAILVGVAATYVPWLFFSQRTVFQFYTVTLEPFLVLALVAVLVWLWKHRLRLFVVNYLIIAVAVSVFFLPVWMGLPIPEWFAVIHYWFPSWI